MKMTQFYQLFGPSLGLTNRQAYSIQEVLQGLEGFDHGRSGPGGGVTATPISLTYFLVAAMVGGPKREARSRMWHWFRTPQEGTQTALFEGEIPEDGPRRTRCPVTGEQLFGPALKAILADPGVADTVERVEVVHEWAEAAITFKRGADIVKSRFVQEADRAHATRAKMSGALCTTTSIGGWLLHQLAIDLKKDWKVPELKDIDWEALAEEENKR